MGRFQVFLYDKFGYGNNPHRNVHCRITTEDGKVIRRDLPAENGYVIWEDCSMAFLLDHSGEVLVRGTNETELILDERDAFPWLADKLTKGKREEWAKTIDQICDNEFARQKNMVAAQLEKDKTQKIIILIFGLAALVILLMILSLFVMNVLL